MHSTKAITVLLPSCLQPSPDGIACKMQVLYLPALLHVVPGAMLHDALLMMGGDVGSDQQVLQLDLSCQDVDVFQ